MINQDAGTAAYSHGDTLRALDYYIRNGNEVGQAVNADGLVLPIWQQSGLLLPAPVVAPVLATADPTPALAVVQAPLAQAQTAGLTVLGAEVSNSAIRANQALVSDNGRYAAVMQADGNFAVYDGVNLIWSTQTTGAAAGGTAVVQRDGNLGIYDADRKAQWYSETSGGAAANRAFTLSMQDDGNLVIYDSRDNSALWSIQTGVIARAAANAAPQAPAPQAPVSTTAPVPVAVKPSTPQPQAATGITVLGAQISNTAMAANQALVSTNGRYQAIMQADGNAVVYDTIANKAIWNSGTAGKAQGGFLNVQTDGNLVVYDAAIKAQWDSKTAGGPATNRTFTLAMQDDGNLVIYDSQNGKALWSSLTGTIAKATGNAIAA